MRTCLLASGSRGNAVFVESGDTRLLIDAGLSARELSRRLGQIGVSPDSLDAVLVTHEHRDHCQGLGPMLGGDYFKGVIHIDEVAHPAFSHFIESYNFV